MVNTDDLDRDFGCHEAMLRSEIGFWREMIDSCGSGEPAETVERMRHALGLAESRLAALLEQRAAAGPIAAAGPGNVYRLAERRKRAQ
jgi:hypothetical protein